MRLTKEGPLLGQAGIEAVDGGRGHVRDHPRPGKVCDPDGLEQSPGARCTGHVDSLGRAVVVSAVALLVLAGCTATSPAPDADGDEMETQAFEVTRDSDSGPRACQPQAVGELMVGFLQKVNAGSDPTSSFASSFQWYSMTEGDPRNGGRHFVTYKRDELSDYFKARARHDESMRLIELSLNYEDERNISHIQYVIERTADDTARFGTMVSGKGAVACGEGKIELLSMGMAKDIMDGMGPLCPKPEERELDAAVICDRA